MDVISLPFFLTFSFARRDPVLLPVSLFTVASSEYVTLASWPGDRNARSANGTKLM